MKPSNAAAQLIELAKEELSQIMSLGSPVTADLAQQRIGLYIPIDGYGAWCPRCWVRNERGVVLKRSEMGDSNQYQAFCQDCNLEVLLPKG